MKAFVIGRPFHLFNSINYVLSNNVKGDAFILNEYKDARKDFERVKMAGVFENVYFVEDSSLRPQNHFLEVLFAIKRGLFPSILLLEAVKEPKISKEHLRGYSEVYSASPGTFALSLISVSKANYFVIEDGAGTYTGKDFKGNQSLKHRLYCMVFRCGALNLDVKGIYVYRPDLCNSELSNNIYKLSPIDPENKELMDAYQKTFDIYNECYRSKFIFLSQRLQGLNIELNLSEFISAIFEKSEMKDYCYRLHPAEAGNVECKNDKYCLPSEMWELLCANYVDPQKVLITINSTAAFSPFKLYNVEPNIVFIYRVVGLSGNNLTVSENLVKSLKERYSDPSKIFVPNSCEELIKIINRLNNENDCCSA